MNTQRDFTKTKAALAHYDALQAEFDADLSSWSTSLALEKLSAIEEAGRAVGRAYVAETSDINSPDKALVITPCAWLRRMIGAV